MPAGTSANARSILLIAALLGCGPASVLDGATGSTDAPASTGDLESTDGAATDDVTTGPAGPYVYEDRVEQLASPPPRGAFTAAALPGGRALVIGGFGVDGDDPGTELDVVAPTILFDLADGFSAGPALLAPRRTADSVVQPDGSVLVFGGNAAYDDFEHAEVLTVERIAADGSATVAVGQTVAPRRTVTALAEPGGTVLVLGDAEVFAERFDPATGASTPLAVVPEFGFDHANFSPLFAAARRGNGEIVALGGDVCDSDFCYFPGGPELIDVDAGTSRVLDASATAATDFHRRALALPGGDVLLLGNPGHSGAPGPWLIRLDDAADILVPVHELGDPDDPDNYFWQPPLGVVLADGRVWIVGQPGIGTATTFYDPATDAVTVGPSLPTAVTPAAAVLLDSGPVLLLGHPHLQWEDPTLHAFLLR